MKPKKADYGSCLFDSRPDRYLKKSFAKVLQSLFAHKIIHDASSSFLSSSTLIDCSCCVNL